MEVVELDPEIPVRGRARVQVVDGWLEVIQDPAVFRVEVSTDVTGVAEVDACGYITDLVVRPEPPSVGVFDGTWGEHDVRLEDGEPEDVSLTGEELAVLELTLDQLPRLLGPTGVKVHPARVRVEVRGGSSGLVMDTEVAGKVRVTLEDPVKTTRLATMIEEVARRAREADTVVTLLTDGMIASFEAGRRYEILVPGARPG